MTIEGKKKLKMHIDFLLISFLVEPIVEVLDVGNFVLLSYRRLVRKINYDNICKTLLSDNCVDIASR